MKPGMKLMMAKVAMEAREDPKLIGAIAEAIGCPGWNDNTCDNGECYCAKAAYDAVKIALGMVEKEAA